MDLGIGRAAGTDRATAFALQRDRRQPPPDDFPEQLDEVLAYFDGREGNAVESRFVRRAVLPGRPQTPVPWLLGSSPQSAVWAGERGLPYCFADFINPAGAEIAALYREHFRPSGWLATPKVMVAGWVVCAEMDDEAERLASSFRMLMALMHRGQLIPVPPVEKALRFLEEQERMGGGLALHRRLIVGEPGTVRAGVEALAREYEAKEVMLVNILYDHAARKRSYELMAGGVWDDSAGRQWQASCQWHTSGSTTLTIEMRSTTWRLSEHLRSCFNRDRSRVPGPSRRARRGWIRARRRGCRCRRGRGAGACRGGAA